MTDVLSSSMEDATDMTLDVQAIRERAEKATPGPWEADSVKTEGSYGTGDDTHEGYHSYQALSPNGRVLFDASNSDDGEVHEDFDEDGFCHAWDEIARRNIEFSAHARTDIPALCDEVDRLRAENESLTTRLIACDEENSLLDIAKNQLEDDYERLAEALTQPVAKGE